MQYLEDKYPEPPLIPHDLQKKALKHQVMIGSATPFFHDYDHILLKVT
jgi:glutathione S-transferase